MKRIMIVGSSGAGKSCFARELQIITKLPLYHLDQMFWKPGWIESDQIDFRDRVKVLVAKDEWLIDGNYGNTISIRAERADVIIFLDYPRWLCVWRALKRFVIGWLWQGNRSDVPRSCRERMTWSFFLWIWTYPYRGRKKALRQINAGGFPLEKVVFFRRQVDKDRFLKNL
jgi:adenylate kinase family enzyme